MNKWEKISGNNQASSAGVGMFKAASNDAGPINSAMLDEALSKASASVNQIDSTMERFPQKPEIVQARELVNSLLKALAPQQLEKTEKSEDTAEHQAASSISVRG